MLIPDIEIIVSDARGPADELAGLSNHPGVEHAASNAGPRPRVRDVAGTPTGSIDRLGQMPGWPTPLHSTA
jgi:hypothetical protein